MSGDTLALVPRICVIRKWANFVGYGFNLHAEKGKAGQFIGNVDDDSPANYSGLKANDKLVEVNGVNVTYENHQQVIVRIKSNPAEVSLLVVDPETEKLLAKNDTPINHSMEGVQLIECPFSKPEFPASDIQIKHLSSTTIASGSHTEPAIDPVVSNGHHEEKVDVVDHVQHEPEPVEHEPVDHVQHEPEPEDHVQHEPEPVDHVQHEPEPVDHVQNEPEAPILTYAVVQETGPEEQTHITSVEPAPSGTVATYEEPQHSSLSSEETNGVVVNVAATEVAVNEEEPVATNEHTPELQAVTVESVEEPVEQAEATEAVVVDTPDDKEEKEPSSTKIPVEPVAEIPEQPTVTAPVAEKLNFNMTAAEMRARLGGNKRRVVMDTSGTFKDKTHFFHQL